MANLKLNDVGKTYGSDVQVLQDVNLDIAQGELVVFVGPSGCGKSTLLRMIAGLESISEGTLEIDGVLVNQVPAAKRGIAMVFQSYALYPHMTVYENMAFALRLAKKSAEDIDKAIHEAARVLQLAPYLNRLPKALSGGQRQRVAIGRAIVRDPKVYLFDEPLSNLDAALRVATRIEIARLKETMPDSTMIYVTHDQVEAMTLADRIVVLAGKTIAQTGTPLELYQNPDNEFVAQFIGSPAMNLFPGRISQAGAKSQVTLTAGGRAIANIETSPEQKGLVVNLGVRPEDLRLASDAEAPLFKGQVTYTEALGEVTLLYFEGQQPLSEEGQGPEEGPEQTRAQVIAKLPGIHNHLRGQHLKLVADPDKLHLFAHGQSLKTSLSK